MKKKIMVFVLLLGIIIWAGFKLSGKEEACWLRTEDDGIKHEISYLHELAEHKPYKARAYLGKPISFAAPFVSAEEDIKLAYYGHIRQLLIFSGSEGKVFLVQVEGNGEYNYMPGEMLCVSGRITSITPERIMLLDVTGTPGSPNEIKLERIK